MIIPKIHNRDDYEVHHINDICEHHKRNPSDVSYAGCGCVSIYSLKLKENSQGKSAYAHN